MPRPHVYCFSGSPYTWRVLIALEEKGIEYEAQYVERFTGEHQSEAMRARNPRMRLPVMIHGDDVLYESAAIVQFLDLAYPEPPLMPQSDADRARALIRLHEQPNLIAVFDGLIGTLMGTKPEQRDPEVVDKLMAGFHAELALWEGYLEADYLAGDRLSVADVGLFPLLAFVVRVGFDAAANGYPRLAAYHARLSARPSVQASSPPHWKDSEPWDVGFADHVRPR
jgi:glutathione S-transferase